MRSEKGNLLQSDEQRLDFCWCSHWKICRCQMIQFYTWRLCYVTNQSYLNNNKITEYLEKRMFLCRNGISFQSDFILFLWGEPHPVVLSSLATPSSRGTRGTGLESRPFTCKACAQFCRAVLFEKLLVLASLKSPIYNVQIVCQPSQYNSLLKYLHQNLIEKHNSQGTCWNCNSKHPVTEIFKGEGELYKKTVIFKHVNILVK